MPTATTPSPIAPTTPATDGRPAFLFDDCCPLCRSYTAAFSLVGWTDRQPFSAIDDTVFAQLDFDRARHQIPLVDTSSGTVRYGLDGILGIAGTKLPALAPLLRLPVVRRPLDGFYWMVTYNRRHIVAAPPPPRGRVDCAPDFRLSAVGAYVAGGTMAAVALTAAAGTAPATTAAVAIGGTMIARRNSDWGVNRAQAFGHLTSIALATAGAGALVAASPLSAPAASIAGAAAGARKIWLRRWMVGPRS